MGNITAKIYAFTSPPKIITGVDSRKNVGAEIKTLGGNVVFVCTKKAVWDEGLLVDILDSLSRNNLAYTIFNEIDNGFSVATVEQCVKIFRNEQCDILLAVGDNNVIDIAKAISYYVNGTPPGSFEMTLEPAVPPYVIALPTSLGIGAGALGNSMINDSGKTGENFVSLPLKVCTEVFLDPVMLQSMPPHDAALSGMVTLANAIEGYVSTTSYELTNLLNLKSIQLAAKYLRRFTANRKNIDAASAMQNAYLYSNLGSRNSGLGNVDAMARSLYVHYGVSYEFSSAVILPVVMEFNAIACPEKFIDIAESFGESTDCLPPHEASLKAVDAIRKLAVDLGVPGKLNDIVVTDHDVERISKEIIDSGSVQKNPRDTTLQDINRLFKKVFGFFDA